MTIRSTLLAAVWLAGLAAAGGVQAGDTLPGLLEEAPQAPLLLAEQAEVERAQAQQDRQYETHGWELFGSAGGGTFDEPVAAGINRRYTGTRATVGVQRPLLGSDEQQRRAIWQARGEAGAAAYRYEQQLQEVRRDIGEQYARIWHAQRAQALSSAMLSVEGELERSLQDRRDQQLMRDDEIGRLQQGLDVARLDADQSAISEDEARLELEGLLGRQVSLPRAPAWFDPQRMTCPLQETDGAPGVRAVEAELESAVERERLTRFNALQSNLQLRYTSTYEDDVSRMGSGLEFVWTVSIPLRAFGGESPLRRELQAEQRRLQHLRAAAQGAALQRQDLAERRLEVHQRRLQAVTAELKRAERSLRVAQERTDDALAVPWEELLPARAEYYRAARARLDATLEIWLAQIACDQFVTEQPRRLERVAQARQVLGASVEAIASLGGPVRIYLWQSAPVIAGRDPAFWPVLERAAVEHIWLSLDGDQIGRYVSSADPLERFIREARRRGVSVGLLLGEPTWTLPEHRKDLVAIIESLAHVDFADLHLDIEIDQLNRYVHDRDWLLEEWLQTVAAAANASPWRVGISAHPRDFGDPDRCLGCEFAERGVDEIALMTYATRPQTLEAQLEPILQRGAGVDWVLAQSVERALPPENSWFQHGWNAMQSGLNAALEPLGRRELPIAIQSYSDLKDMWADEDSL
ncbi:TolC family protein [Thioalkalivibrio sp. ALMg11]|uniref:TolC family protein n=1 Tax=Thioalkalivibrio sp. ALMg11 TaxID=1158165 RepID=UPI000475C645|nr:TolC family protein [Thioalkalivibrio sp. ALMg11]